MTKLTAIEGIGEKFQAKLHEAGIRSTEELLRVGATPQGRTALAEKSGVKPALILEWVNHSDLFRIKGVGPQYADLLEAAGVDTVPELARRKPENLLKKMEEVNGSKNCVRRLPLQQQVTAWIEQAKLLERVIKY